jgi:heme/copper-type cytochrome/quinol oxidase subunit 4
MMWVMISVFAKKMPDRVRGYVRENLGAPFIVGFMLLLVFAAVSLSVGLAVLANGIAIVAYYALVVGVFLQLVCFLKYNKKNGEKNLEPS